MAGGFPEGLRGSQEARRGGWPPLDGEHGCERGRGGGKGRAEGVADGLEDVAAMAFGGLAEDAVVASANYVFVPAVRCSALTFGMASAASHSSVARSSVRSIQLWSAPSAGKSSRIQ